MAIQLTDAEIISLLSEPKELPTYTTGNRMTTCLTLSYGSKPSRRFTWVWKPKDLSDPLADIKKGSADRWVGAVNADGSYWKWAYEMVRQVSEVNEVVSKATERVI